ncbi:hypothetical protein [Actinomadura macrotermitis]|uniref:Uncharacterized protein n=1 Tax=Actinomadura macrotermitis TaxID=2585200 RepID=A0A7K0BPJ9_9ACTN|nr:hypothetical protein [Actinomadura macrotermitis]MQY03118.1 hypothetical protein [Actinomadura macrotermitis]
MKARTLLWQGTTAATLGMLLAAPPAHGAPRPAAGPGRVQAPPMAAAPPVIALAPPKAPRTDDRPFEGPLAPIGLGAVLLAAGIAAWRRTPAPAPPPARPAAGGGRPAPSAAGLAAELARPAGLGVTGPGADAFVRTVLVELLDDAGPGARVVITRADLDRLFGPGTDPALWQALGDRLRVCELLEEGIEHLELELLMAEAERANPDLSPTGGRGLPPTCWICTPGQDDDVVLPLVRRRPGLPLAGLLFGDWPHGRTREISATGRIGDVTVALLPPGEALARLRAQAAAERPDRY